MKSLRRHARHIRSVTNFSPTAFAELRDDPTATVPAVGVVVVATLLAALGGLFWALVGASPPPIFTVDIPRFVVRSVMLGSFIQVGMWCAWVGMTWFVLRHIFFVEDVTWRRLARAMGFAFAPMALQILLLFPVLEFPVGLIALGATVAASATAVQAAAASTQQQALIATVVGFALFALVLGILGNSDTDLAPGIFALDPNAVSVGLKLKV